MEMEVAQLLAFLTFMSLLFLPADCQIRRSIFYDCDSDGSERIDAERFCNGVADCSNGNDEIYFAMNNESIESGIPCRRDEYICLLPTRYIQNKTIFCRKDVVCSEDEFECLDHSACLPQYSFCDGNKHCKDGSDELQLHSSENGIPCRRDRYRCKLPENTMEKKNIFCTKDVTCSEHEFECLDHSMCLRRYSFCDGKEDCKDGSDELQLDSSENGIPCRRDRYRCKLPENEMEKKNILCTKSVTCSDYEFECLDHSACLPQYSFCDGNKDCKDGSDELPLDLSENRIPCRLDKYICKLPENEIKKKNIFCKKNISCSEDEFECLDHSACLSKYTFCDGYKHCRDGSDELPLSSSENGIPCRRDRYKCKLPENEKEKKDNFCTKNMTCLDSRFHCEDKSECLPWSWFCDGIQQCSDGSDEKRIRKKTTNGFQFCDSLNKFSPLEFAPLKCEVPTSNTCPEVAFCLSNPSDFMDGKCFRCLQYPYVVIPVAKLCNGYFDCPDLSDECMCNTKNRPEICEKVLWKLAGDEEPHITRQAFTCQVGNGLSEIMKEEVCDGKIDCADGKDESDCSEDVYATQYVVREVMVKSKNYTCRFDNETHKASRCDGVPECKYDIYYEECECPYAPDFCNFIETTRQSSFLRCNTTDYWNEIHGTGSVYGTSICDGVSHCKDQKDELYCSNRTHFYCRSRTPTFIPIQKTCNLVVDCDDESDESFCNFRCFGSNGVHYIGNEQVCNGVQNCGDGGDECEPGCVISAFSDNLRMINSFLILFILLFISMAALMGNSAVIRITFCDLFLPKKKPFVRDNKEAQRQRILINRVLVLNLAVSDLLVGIYTFLLCAKGWMGYMIEGAYCLVDRDWRSATACSAFGVFLVIGSQQSVFTMILVTASRLLGIRELHAETPIKRLLTAVVLTWIVSIALAVIPLLPCLEDTFITSISYEQNALFTTIEQNDIKNITMWLLTMANSSGELHGRIGSWSALDGLIGKLNLNLTVGRKFGFYSTHSVCIPDLFPDPANNASWWYSLLLIGINFVSFVFIMFGCILIYRHATRKNVAVSDETHDERSSKIQRKLTLIVMTDFFCWIPVCIMAICQISGVTITQDWRLVVGLIIIPINSAMNPAIYLNVPANIWVRTKRFCVSIYSFVENDGRERPVPPAEQSRVIQEETAV